MSFRYTINDVCFPDAKVQWRHVHRLAYTVEELFGYNDEYLDIYSNDDAGFSKALGLVENQFLPYQFHDLPSCDILVQHFEVNPGAEIATDITGAPCPTVGDRYLLDDFQNEGGQKIDFDTVFPKGVWVDPIKPKPAFMKEYADNDKLFYIVEEDDCWCKTIFKVKPEGNFYTLDKVEATDPVYGCCMTRGVPDVGELLDSEQDIIPAGVACQWGDANGMNPDFINRKNPIYCNKCDTGTGNGDCQENPDYDTKIEYTLAGPAPDGDSNRWVLTDAGRNMKGYFTWPILDEHFEFLYNRIVTAISYSGGSTKSMARPGDITKNQPLLSNGPSLWFYDEYYGPDGGHVDTNGWTTVGGNCNLEVISIDKYLAHLGYQYTSGDDTVPASSQDVMQYGTIVEPEVDLETAGAWGVGGKDIKRPWEKVTGGGLECGMTGEPRVYCETLRRIYELVTQIWDRHYPNSVNPADDMREQQFPNTFKSGVRRTCCLRFPAFLNAGDGCLDYYQLIVDWFCNIFVGDCGNCDPVPGCDSPDWCGCDYGDPDVGLNNDCSFMTCGPLIRIAGSAGLPLFTAATQNCLNQGSIIWSYQTHEVQPNYCLPLGTYDFIRLDPAVAP